MQNLISVLQTQPRSQENQRLKAFIGKHLSVYD
jgi:hypothetical protein